MYLPQQWHARSICLPLAPPDLALTHNLSPIAAPLLSVPSTIVAACLLIGWRLLVPWSETHGTNGVWANGPVRRIRGGEPGAHCPGRMAK